MKKILLPIVGAALLLSVSFAFGQAPNTTVQFTGGTQGTPYGSVETGYYDGTLNGVAVGPNQPGGPGMVCDDYVDEIGPGNQWTAYAQQASNINAMNVDQTRFGSSIGIAGYAELAYLLNYMFTTYPSSANLSQAALDDLGNLSQAIWCTSGGISCAVGTISQAAHNYYEAAVSYASSTGDSMAQYTNLWLYTAKPPGQTSQEMWGLVPVPEGGAALMYLLLAGVTCFGAMFYSRRQSAMGA